MNPLDEEVFGDLATTFIDFDQRQDIGAVILTGNGDKYFASGADIRELMGCSVGEITKFSQISRRAFDAIENCGLPTIAAVNGFCLGGGMELALACDFRIVSETAKFGQPELNLGIIPGGGSTQRLQRLIGQSRTKELLYFGEIIDAKTALLYGIANRVTSQERLMDSTNLWAQRLALKPAFALRVLKLAIQSGGQIDLSNGLSLEYLAFMSAFAHEDRIEGMQAFIDKKPPKFSGR